MEGQIQKIKVHISIFEYNRFNTFLGSVFFIIAPGKRRFILVLFFCFSFRYFIDYNAEDDRFFNIDANTGTIKTTKVLDREETPWYNITVAASENGKLLYFMYHRKDVF